MKARADHTGKACWARGGRELAPALDTIGANAATPAAWAAAFRAHNLDADRYVLDRIPPAAPVPWEHIGGCVLTVEEDES